MRRCSQRSGWATLSGLFSGFFGGKAIFFGRCEDPPYSRSTSRFVQLGKIVSAGVLEAQATPPDRLARRQRVCNEFDASEVLLVRHQSFEEFKWPHPFTEQPPRLLLEVEVRADLGGCGGLDLD